LFLPPLSCRLLTSSKVSGHVPGRQDVRAAANRHEMKGATRFGLTDGSPINYFDEERFGIVKTGEFVRKLS
jgi:hypothetical protein